MNDDKLNKVRELIEVQGSNGNWNYDPYMHGMYNGMEMIVSILEERDPEFRNAPDEWLRDSVKTMNNFKWSETTTSESEFYYTDFEEYFKSIASRLWVEKQWDNETIKCWLENAFMDGRIK